MSDIQILDSTEAQAILSNSLNLLDCIYAYSIAYQLPSDTLFDKNVRKRLQSLYSPKLPGSIHLLLDKLDGVTDEEKKTLSLYYYKIENLAGGSDEVISGLEAYCKLMQVRNTTSKGEVIDIIIRCSDHKTIENVAKILDIISSLAF
ncbi:uncharacterized protein RAG0_13257 [Rhynchosporium agropyri]|uniref:Uncharacterized protein n=1 Tax=Rhynchosporium agropyri TaxID=914238 RepID=A0A1E1LC56_9HELO|nr:uncharacterized protein RAG0_13257 [Rhynchosporium agropyri]